MAHSAHFYYYCSLCLKKHSETIKFKFPTERFYLNKWIDFVRDRIGDKKWRPGPKAYLCEIHFKSEDIIVNHRENKYGKRACINREAIPKFPPSPSHIKNEIIEKDESSDNNVNRDPKDVMFDFLFSSSNTLQNNNQASTILNPKTTVPPIGREVKKKNFVSKNSFVELFSRDLTNMTPEKLLIHSFFIWSLEKEKVRKNHVRTLLSIDDKFSDLLYIDKTIISKPALLITNNTDALESTELDNSLILNEAANNTKSSGLTDENDSSDIQRSQLKRPWSPPPEPFHFQSKVFKTYSSAKKNPKANHKNKESLNLPLPLPLSEIKTEKL